MPMLAFRLCLMLVALLCIVHGAQAAGWRDAHPFLKKFYKIDVFSPPLNTNVLAFQAETADAPAVTITSARGHWLILNIWATWCAPCLYELPFFDTLQAQNADLAVWAVSVDQAMDPRVLTATRKRFGLNNIALMHDTMGQLPKMIDTTKLPATLIIDPNGQIHTVLYGQGNWASDTAADFVAALPHLWAPGPPPDPIYVKQTNADLE